MDKKIVQVAMRLASVKEHLGRRAFRDAVARALLGIAVAAHREAERRAARGGRWPRRASTAAVIRFPLARARPRDDGKGGGP